MKLEEARTILHELTKTNSLLRHARSIELVMTAYAKKYGENEEQWAIAGLLHDADYEAHPSDHPNIIVGMLREKGEEAIAHAISAHYTKWGVEYNSLLDKVLLACDELTGFIIACCHVRPDGVNGLAPKSVIKKLKQKSFASKVERDEVQKGIELLEVDRNVHIAFIISVLQENMEELEIG